MGDITDMILEGLLDEETGEYIGDQNLVEYGEEAPGFPIRRSKKNRSQRKARKPSPAPSKSELRKIK